MPLRPPKVLKNPLRHNRRPPTHVARNEFGITVRFPDGALRILAALLMLAAVIARMALR